jgi:AcrR family transcriptional regulator
MTSRPFHHGNLRAVLLEQAEAMLRRGGVDGLSLRELARQAGVSHGAPRSHFIDRQALLDALAERGFTRFTEKVSLALDGGGDFADRFTRVGRAYVDFAVDNAALMELMFTARASDEAGPVDAAAGRLFRVLDEAIGAASDTADSRDARERFKFLFAATMQGTAALVTAQRISRSQGETVVDDATETLLASRLGRSVVPPE